MEHALKFVEYSVATIIFTIAVSLLLTSRNNMNMLISSVEDTVKDTNVMYESAGEDISTADEIISYTQLCTLLAGPLEYDVVVISNGTSATFTKDDYNYLMFDFSSIPSANYYRRTYVYNTDDVIKSIQYEKVN